MAANLIALPFRPTINLRGGVEAGARLEVYATGTLTPVQIFADDNLTTPLANPLVADAFGVFPDVYYSDALAIRVILKQANGVVLSDTDPYVSTVAAAEAILDDAAEAAADAQAAAVVASAFSGPFYTTTVAGINGTESGDEFAVRPNVDDTTADIYVNNAGTAVFSRTVIIAPGDSGASAEIGHIATGTGAVPETVGVALRREVWADQYKLAVDAHDGPCITRAVAAMLAAGGGGVVRLSRRAYTLNEPITFSGLNNVRIVGAGQSASGTLIRENFTTGDGITFSACQSSELSGVMFWPVVRKTSGFSVALSNACYDCRVDIRSDFGWNGLLINGASETRYKVNCRYLLGTNGVVFTGTISSQSFRAIAEDQLGDNPFPSPVLAVASNKKTFTGGMTLDAGDHFIANGAIWQCVTGGTAAGSAPSGYPAGTSPESVFFTDLTSGTAALRFVANASLTHLTQGSYAYSLVVLASALLNGARGFAMEDAANTGSSYPIWAFMVNLECDNNYTVGVDLVRGEGFEGGGLCWIGASKTGNGVVVGANFRGDVIFGAGTRIMGNAQNGVIRSAGPVDVRFDGAEVNDNSAEGSGLYNGLFIQTGSSHTQINGGTFGDSVSVSGNNQGFGIFIDASTINTSIIGASVRGNATGAINVGATQTGLMIKDCPGYNASASAAITVGASPFAYENATGADALVSITGGTVSDIAMDGVTLATATGGQFYVPAGATLTVTYSGAPTMARRLL